MCGIVGYVGSREATPLLMEGLKCLEYRGYDSAGLAVIGNGAIERIRAAGKIANLEKLLKGSTLSGKVALGHTRWATHGKPSEENAHPHTDCGRSLVVIHNGIIENYLEIKKRLAASGHRFDSETDTETVVHLVEEKLKEMLKGRKARRGKEMLLFEAVRRALVEVRGAYAVAVLWSEAPGVIVAAKTASPLVIGLGSGENFLASDVPAFLAHTRKVVFLEDGEMALLKKNSVSFFTIEGKGIKKAPTDILWDHAMAEKAGYRHFMLKEIHEQATACEDTLRGRMFPLKDDAVERDAGIKRGTLKGLKKIHLVACGTAYHAGLVGRYWLENLAGVPTNVETSSEFRYRDPIVGKGEMVIAVSQSGETADTLAAVRLAKEKGARVLSVCNCVGSTITRYSDYNLYTHCGPEFGVASTKAFIGQLTALALLAVHAAVDRRRLSPAGGRAVMEEIMRLPGWIRAALKLEPAILKIARKLYKKDHFLFIGRNLNFPIALEGALKLKEISYIHAEGYAAGELKHGPIALIDSEMPVVALATRSPILEKMISSLEEVRSRGAQLIVLATEGDALGSDEEDLVLRLPPVPEFLSPIVNVIPLQLLAYHIADLRGCDVDQPRNLAKSVTVE